MDALAHKFHLLTKKINLLSVFFMVRFRIRNLRDKSKDRECILVSIRGWWCFYFLIHLYHLSRPKHAVDLASEAVLAFFVSRKGLALHFEFLTLETCLPMSVVNSYHLILVDREHLHALDFLPGPIPPPTPL